MIYFYKSILKLLIFINIFLFSISTAYAATYTYTSTPFTTIASAPYSTGMQITFTFTTAVPIPPNTVDFDLKTGATSWTAFDGVNTIDDTNGLFLTHQDAFVSTDASGAISDNNVTVAEAPEATVLGDTRNTIWINSATGTGAADRGILNGVCITINVSSGLCEFYSSFDPNTSTFLPQGGTFNVQGTWAAQLDTKPKPVPSLTSWALLILILSLLFLSQKNSLLLNRK